MPERRRLFEQLDRPLRALGGARLAEDCLRLRRLVGAGIEGDAYTQKCQQEAAAHERSRAAAEAVAWATTMLRRKL
eukprot:3066808-Prymnesium_polylepis.1